jgi:hypothetical protein
VRVGYLTDEQFADEVAAAVGGSLSGAFEPPIAAGTIAQYWRGDKTWQSLNAAAVGLGNVENKSSATIRGEITSGNITTGLGYTPTSVTGLTGVQSVVAFKSGLGLAAIASTGSASDLAAGTVPAARMPAHTGDVTSSAGSVALTIGNDTVTYAKMQDVSAPSRLLGRGDGGVGDPQEITLGSGLSMSGTTLSAGAGGSAYEAGPSTPPLTTDFSWVRQGTSTASDGAGSLVFTPQPDDTFRGFIQAAPGGNFTVYCRVEELWNTTNTTTAPQSYAGIAVRNSAQTRVVLFGLAQFNSIAQKHAFRRLDFTGDGSTVSAASTAKTLPYAVRWVRVEYDGTNLIASVSPNGFEWLQIDSVTAASFLTAAGGSLDGIGFGARSSSTSIPTQFYSYFSTTAPA